MKQILIVKPKTISAKDKLRLEKSGIIIIEHSFPDQVRIVTETEGLSGNDLLISAFHGLQNCGAFSEAKVSFVNELARRIKLSEQK